MSNAKPMDDVRRIDIYMAQHDHMSIGRFTPRQLRRWRKKANQKRTDR